MRTLALATAVGVLSASASLAADALIGTVWKTNVDDGKYAHVEMVGCGAEICGVFRKTFDADGEYASESIGKYLVEGMSAEGDGYYSGGTIWEPSSDKKYRSNMQLLDAKSMRVKGCVAIICKKFVWTKVN